MAGAPSPIPLRFQRSELEAKADLSPEGQQALAQIGHPEKLIAHLVEGGHVRDAVNALTLLLPHRQTVWWACLSARLIPDLDRRGNDMAAIAAAEAWVQTGSADHAARAGELALAGNRDAAPAWVAMAAYWSGPTIAPRGSQAVPPPPHLPGVAARSAMLLLMQEKGLADRINHGDLLGIGRELMLGGNGGTAQVALRSRLSEPVAGVR